MARKKSYNFSDKKQELETKQVILLVRKRGTNEYKAYSPQLPNNRNGYGINSIKAVVDYLVKNQIKYEQAREIEVRFAKTK